MQTGGFRSRRHGSALGPLSDVLRKLVANRQLPAQKVGGRWLIEREKAEAFRALEPGRAGSPRKL